MAYSPFVLLTSCLRTPISGQTRASHRASPASIVSLDHTFENRVKGLTLCLCYSPGMAKHRVCKKEKRILPFNTLSRASRRQRCSTQKVSVRLPTSLSVCFLLSGPSACHRHHSFRTLASAILIIWEELSRVSRAASISLGMLHPSTYQSSILKNDFTVKQICKTPPIAFPFQGLAYSNLGTSCH